MKNNEYLNTYYRRDIDGLRALSVLLVIFYHIGVNFARAGFIGVDVFFVISGFLITFNICRDLEKGCFSLKQFFIRRMKRILPALLIVLCLTTIFAYFFLFPSDLKNYSDSLIATLLSISNFYFWNYIHMGYFSTEAHVIPLLHTWSLGVEEQFYFVWPFFLVILFQIFTNKGHILTTLIFLSLCSFFTYYFFRDNIQLVYYSPITRGYELLLGAILASMHNKFDPVKNRLLLHLLSLIGLSFIVYAGSILTANDYPGFNVLLPTLGASVLIYTGKNNGIANKMLCMPPLVFIGLISYSLYLWHWPIIAFVNYFGVPLNFIIRFCIISLLILLAFLTWKFVEQPLKQTFKFDFQKKYVLLWALPFLMLGLFFVRIQFIPNFGFNQISNRAQAAIANQNFGPLDPNGYCHNINGLPSKLGEENDCAIGNVKHAKAQVLLTGDSHAMSANGMINVFLTNANLKGFIATQAGTPFVSTSLGKTFALNDFMQTRNSILEKLIKQQHYEYVVLGGNWSVYPYIFKKKSMTDRFGGFKLALTETVKFIIKNKSIPVILLDVPPLKNVSVTCGLSRISLHKCYNSIYRIKKEQAQTRQIFLEIKKHYPQVILIDPTEIICHGNKCHSSIKGIPLYFTGQSNSHLNYTGSTLIGEHYLKKYGNPFGSHYNFCMTS